MNYNTLKEKDPHLETLIKWLFDEVISAGGDGDGIWFTHIYNVMDIHKFIIDNELLPKHWGFEIRTSNVSYSSNQESLYITNNPEDFDSRPSWQQVSLAY